MCGKIISIACCAWCLLAWPKLVLAQVVINEIMPAPSTGNDWVELINQGDQSVNLTSWSVEDSTSAMTTNPAISGQTLPSKGFLVVEVGNRLNNTGDSVKLKNQLGLVVDSFSYTQTTPDLSWARLPDGSGSFEQSPPSRGTMNQISTSSASPSPAPSPSPSSSPTPTPATTPLELPSHIAISEIMACPNTNEPEWVELQNLANQEVTLSSWELKDAQNNARYFTATLPAQGLTVIQMKPGMLNNDGDQLSVIRPDGVTTSWASYTKCEKGQSLIFDGQSWIPALPTPGIDNPDLEPTASVTPSPTASPLPTPTPSPSISPSPTFLPTPSPKVMIAISLSTPAAYLSPVAEPLTDQATLPVRATPNYLSSWIFIASGGWLLIISSWNFICWWQEARTHHQNPNSTLGSFLQL